MEPLQSLKLSSAIFILLAALVSADPPVQNIKCYVCSNSKGKANNNPFFKDKCLDISKMSEAAKKSITVDCNNDYDKYFLEKLGAFATTNNSGNGTRSAPSVDKRCLGGVYSHCKSIYYYQKNPIKVKMSGSAGNEVYSDEVGPFDGDTERVFRMCGCDDAKKQSQGQKLKPKSECNDVTLGTNRRRYCKCKSPDGKPCNSTWRGVSLSSTFILLLAFVSVMYN